MFPASAVIYYQVVQFFEQYAFSLIITSIITGAVVAVISHYIYNIRPQNAATKRNQEILEEEIAQRNETSRIRMDEEIMSMLLEGRGSMNTNALRKNRVAFKPEVEEQVREISTDYYEDSQGEVDDDDDEKLSSTEFENGEMGENEDEEQMPQINKRTVLSSSTRHVNLPDEDNPIDGDRISSTLGKLHGKLATAQLKSQTRKMAAEMSQEERDYEARMKAKQMESIMALMMQDQEKFGMSNEEDIKDQLNLYNF